MTALLMSCQTLPPEIVTVIEYRDRPIPEINWPQFPDPKGIVKQNADGSVSMPLDYWLKLTKYVIDVEAGIDILEASRGATP